MTGRTQPGLIVSGLLTEPIAPSPWKDFWEDIKKTIVIVRRGTAPTVPSERVDRCVKSPALSGLLVLWLARGLGEQAGIRCDVCEVESCHTASLQSTSLKMQLQRLERMLPLSPRCDASAMASLGPAHRNQSLLNGTIHKTGSWYFH